MAQEKERLSNEYEILKMTAVEAYMEKEKEIEELTSKLDKFEGRDKIWQENQDDLEKEREDLQRKILALANMLDREAEANEIRRKNLEMELENMLEKQLAKETQNNKEYE